MTWGREYRRGSWVDVSVVVFGVSIWFLYLVSLFGFSLWFLDLVLVEQVGMSD